MSHIIPQKVEQEQERSVEPAVKKRTPWCALGTQTSPKSEHQHQPHRACLLDSLEVKLLDAPIKCDEKAMRQIFF